MDQPSRCPHFSRCSGCELDQNFLNPPVWQEALAYFQKIDPSLVPQLMTLGFSQTRTKAKLAVRSPSEIGLFKKGTHDVISIPHCLVHHSAINRAALLLKTELAQSPIPLYNEKTNSGHLRYLQLAVDPKTEKVQLVLVLNTPHSTPQIETLSQTLFASRLFHSIWLNFQPASTNKIFGDAWQHLHGEPFLWQKINDTQIAFHPAAFSQAHFTLFEKMVHQIEAWIPPQSTLLELYAGVGAIGLSLRHKAKQIHLVENNPYAHLSFQQSLARLEDPTPFSYLCIDAKDAPLSPYDTLIVDPPRKGLDPTLLHSIAPLKNTQLIYVSCGFESFRKDTETLLASGWKFENAAGYLLFPGTNHVEILARLTSS